MFRQRLAFTDSTPQPRPLAAVLNARRLSWGLYTLSVPLNQALHMSQQSATVRRGATIETVNQVCKACSLHLRRSLSPTL